MLPEQYVERLCETLARKYDLLSDILSLTRRQAENIKDDGLETLQSLVNDKQVKIDAVKKVDEEFEVYFRRLKSELKVNRLDELKDVKITGVDRLQEAVSAVVKLLNEISRLEKQNNDRAQALLDHLGNEIRKINLGKKTNSAYMPGPVKPPSYFIDKKK